MKVLHESGLKVPTTIKLHRHSTDYCQWIRAALTAVQLLSSYSLVLSPYAVDCVFSLPQGLHQLGQLHLTTVQQADPTVHQLPGVNSLGLDPGSQCLCAALR